MQYVYDINSSFSITFLFDLPTLRTILEACHLKPNYSKIARELGKDRRTVQTYYLNGVPEIFNVLLLILSFSRYKFAKVTFDRIQTTLQDALVGFFEQMDGVPVTILTDNMKTIMLEPRVA